MAKLSDRFKNVHEETINETYNVTCMCTDELKTLYNNEEIDSTMLMGKVTHEYWNNFNCKDNTFLWSYNESTAEYTRNEETQDINNVTSVCLIKSNSHNTSLNVGIDTTEENTTTNSYKLITDMNYNNIVLAMSVSNWDKSGNYWVKEGNDDGYSNYAKLHVFYKVDKGNGVVELIDLERNVSIGVINDNKITVIESINYLNDDQYNLTTTSGVNSLNNGTVGKNINGKIYWHGNQERSAKDSSTSVAYIKVNRYMWAGTGYVREINQMTKYKYLRAMMASLGFKYILVDPSIITTEAAFNASVHQAYMNDDGEIDYDNILIGKEAIDNSDTKNKDISYDKLPAIDNNRYIDKVDLNKDFFSFAGTAFTKMYALSVDDMYQLKRDFMTLPQGFEPLKSIVSVMNFPFDISADHSSYNDFIIGGQTLPTKQKELTTPYVVLNLGKCKVPRKYNDFRDLSPYTDLKLYIPYCTDVELNASVYMGKTLSVEMIVDLSSGQCVACVYCDGIPTTFSSGVIGNDIVLSSNGANMKSAAMLQSLLGIGASGLALGGSIATGNAVGAAGSVYGMITSVANSIITGNKNYSSSIGSTQGYVNNIKPQYCYLTISRPNAEIPSNYGHTVGFIVNEEKTVKDCDGYTVFSNVDTTSLRCNDLQKSRIKSLLESGVYI